MNLSKLVLGACLGALLAAPSRAQSEPTPEQLRGAALLDEARAAALRPGTVRYGARYRHAFVLDREIWTGSGTVWAQRASPGRAGELRIDAELKAPEAQTAERVSLVYAAGDAQAPGVFTYVNHTGRWWTRGSHAGVGGVPSLVTQGLALPLYDVDDPFGDQEAPLAEPAVSFGGALCRVLVTEAKDDPTETRWLLGPDLAPRLVERSNSSCCGEDVQTRLLLDPLVTRNVDRPEALALDGYVERPPQAPVDAIAAEAIDSIPLTLLEASRADFVTRFNAAADKPRVVGLFAPT